MEKQIQKAIDILKSGGIVIFPTDTAFGIGCRMDDEQAVRRLFKIRRRPKDQAFSALTDSIEMAKQYLMPVNSDVLNLMKKYWPGALTIILPCRKEKVPDVVRGGKDTLGVRMPDNEIILSIIRGVGVPILGPSANFHGEKTPYRFEDLDPELIKLADYVVFGECAVKQASTVLDCTKTPWRIVREGIVSLSF